MSKADGDRVARVTLELVAGAPPPSEIWRVDLAEWSARPEVRQVGRGRHVRVRDPVGRRSDRDPLAPLAHAAAARPGRHHRRVRDVNRRS
jgi:hypothetical protein